MFDKFSDRARKIIALAMKEAVRLRHDYIGPEHLLLGLAAENTGVAMTALSNLGITSEKIQREVEKILVIGKSGGNEGPLPFTPQAKRVLERASEEAHHLGHPYIGTEHILLGIFSDEKCVATCALANLDISAEKIRKEVLELLGQQIDPPNPKPINHVILMTNAAKTYIREAIEHINQNKNLFPSLGMITGFKTAAEGDSNHIEYNGSNYSGTSTSLRINQRPIHLTFAYLAAC
jgi:ATP-dependent Clp protease ATP-binding subunit ClpA